MKSLYYKSLNAHMRKSRKEQNMQEMLDQVHNLNLKQKLNTDLKREQAILNPIAADLKRQEITDKYKEHLGQYKEQKLRRKAENKAKIDLYKNQFNQSKDQKLIDAERERLRINKTVRNEAKQVKKEAKRAAKNSLFDDTPMAVEVVSHPYGTTKAGNPRIKPGLKEGKPKYKTTKYR